MSTTDAPNPIDITEDVPVMMLQFPCIHCGKGTKITITPWDVPEELQEALESA